LDGVHVEFGGDELGKGDLDLSVLPSGRMIEMLSNEGQGFLPRALGEFICQWLQGTFDFFPDEVIIKDVFDRGDRWFQWLWGTLPEP